MAKTYDELTFTEDYMTLAALLQDTRDEAKKEGMEESLEISIKK